jgi:hypothetical protein
MLSEVTVILKDSEKTYRQKFLCYEAATLSPNDPVLVSYIEEAKATASFEPDDIRIKISMEV